MRLFAMTLVLFGAALGSAQGSVLSSRNLTLGGQIFAAPEASLLIDGPLGLFGLDSGAGDPVLALNGLSPAPGTVLGAAQFELLLEEQINLDFLSAVGVALESQTDRLEVLFATDAATGSFAAVSPLVLAVITGGFGDALGLGTQFAGDATVRLFNTSRAAAIPLPASLPLLLGALVGLGALRWRRA